MKRTAIAVPERLKSQIAGLEKEFKELPFTKAAVDREKSTFEGYSAGIGNRDEGGDIIWPGAFAKTIRERVPASRVKWLDQHNYASTENLWGVAVNAREEPVSAADMAKYDGASHLLWTQFKASSVDPAQRALIKIDEGILDGLSIGYRPLKVDFEADEDADESDPMWAWFMGQGTRNIRELIWYETSSVIFGMNPAAAAIPGTVKSLKAFAELATRYGYEVDQTEVRGAVEALGRLLKDGKDHPETLRVLGKGQDVPDLLRRLDLAINQVDRLAAGKGSDRALIVRAFDMFRERVGDAKDPGLSFITFVGQALDGDGKSADPDASSGDAADSTGVQAAIQDIRTELGTIKEQLTALAGTGSDGTSQGGAQTEPPPSTDPAPTEPPPVGDHNAMQDGDTSGGTGTAGAQGADATGRTDQGSDTTPAPGDSGADTAPSGESGDDTPEAVAEKALFDLARVELSILEAELTV